MLPMNRLPWIVMGFWDREKVNIRLNHDNGTPDKNSGPLVGRTTPIYWTSLNHKIALVRPLFQLDAEVITFQKVGAVTIAAYDDRGNVLGRFRIRVEQAAEENKDD